MHATCNGREGRKMGVIRRKSRGKVLPHWYGTWQVDGRREWRRLVPWEGRAPAEGEERGDEAFERSRAAAERMLAEIRAGADEGLAEIRARVLRHIAGTGGDNGALLALASLLAELQVRALAAVGTEGRAQGVEGEPFRLV